MRLGLRLLGVAFLAVVAVSSAGCSFRSTQYEFLKSLVSKKEESRPRKSWIVEWNGHRTPVYAVNGVGFVFFVDEFGVQVKYQDAQITGVKGLLPMEEVEGIAVSVTQLGGEVKLGYRFLGESTTEVHSCSLWVQTGETKRKEAKVSMWVQNCVYLNFKYQNRRWFNEMGQLVKLEYLLKRGYPHANIFLF